MSHEHQTLHLFITSQPDNNQHTKKKRQTNEEAKLWSQKDELIDYIENEKKQSLSNLMFTMCLFEHVWRLSPNYDLMILDCFYFQQTWTNLFETNLESLNE